MPRRIDLTYSRAAAAVKPSRASGRPWSVPYDVARGYEPLARLRRALVRAPLARGKLDVLDVVDMLVRDRRQQVRDQVQACGALVVGLDDVPRARVGVG